MKDFDLEGGMAHVVQGATDLEDYRVFSVFNAFLAIGMGGEDGYRQVSRHSSNLRGYFREPVNEEEALYIVDYVMMVIKAMKEVDGMPHMPFDRLDVVVADVLGSSGWLNRLEGGGGGAVIIMQGRAEGEERDVYLDKVVSFVCGNIFDMGSWGRWSDEELKRLMRESLVKEVQDFMRLKLELDGDDNNSTTLNSSCYSLSKSGVFVYRDSGCENRASGSESRTPSSILNDLQSLSRSDYMEATLRQTYNHSGKTRIGKPYDWKTLAEGVVGPELAKVDGWSEARKWGAVEIEKWEKDMSGGGDPLGSDFSSSEESTSSAAEVVERHRRAFAMCKQLVYEGRKISVDALSPLIRSLSTNPNSRGLSPHVPKSMPGLDEDSCYYGENYPMCVLRYPSPSYVHVVVKRELGMNRGFNVKIRAEQCVTPCSPATTKHLRVRLVEGEGKNQCKEWIRVVDGNKHKCSEWPPNKILERKGKGVAGDTKKNLDPDIVDEGGYQGLELMRPQNNSSLCWVAIDPDEAVPGIRLMVQQEMCCNAEMLFYDGSGLGQARAIRGLMEAPTTTENVIRGIEEKNLPAM